MPNRHYKSTLAVLAWGLLGWGAACHGQAIDFAREVRPILSDKCFQCHGPDEHGRQAGLRLDLRESAVLDRGGYAAVKPGSASDSEAIRRMLSDDPAEKMPPAESGKSLSPAEIETLKRWIDEGAEWGAHWAFTPPQRPQAPTIQDAPEGWAASPIDAFVLRKLRSKKLAPSAEADRETLLRRVTLDLIGLPPTIEEREAFLNDDRPGAYGRLVDRLLASPHYGEKWGRFWLDAARYADSDGYEKDKQRANWFYRDWVINALNHDKPFDRFIIEQVAGDLLPGAGQDELVATGFLRNSMVNEEGGADPEQFRVEGLFDRMDALGKSILGLTTQCSQCHSHKFDPLTHHDYYRMMAFLNNSYEAIIVAYTPEEQLQIESIKARIAKLEESLRKQSPNWRESMQAWADQQRIGASPWQVVPVERENFTGEKFAFLKDGSVLSRSFAGTQITGDFVCEPPPGRVTAVRVEFLRHPELPRGGPGRSIYGTHALTEFRFFHTTAAGERTQHKLASATASIQTPSRPIGYPFTMQDPEKDKRLVGPIEYAIDEDLNTAWSTLLGPAVRNQPHQAVFVLPEAIQVRAGDKLTFRLKQDHGGWNANDNQSNIAGRFRFAITGDAAPVADPLPAEVRKLVQAGAASWTSDQRQKVFSYWRTTQPEFSAVNEEIDSLLAQHPEGTNQNVVKERPGLRDTHVLLRGDFLKPGDLVTAGTPEFLHPMPSDAPRNRLAFAEWLVDRRSPTTARSLVNRVWQEYFGLGIVETAEDLGSQAPPPSHPELLDWLAVEFMDSGWRLKHLHRSIVTSAAYRQASDVTPELLERDPQNRLVTRGPSVRVHAEVVRDAALAASGLLNDQVGGPPVYPPAPAALFLPPASYGTKPWETTTSSKQYRRSMYVHAYRSTPYPVLQVFDAPTGAAACVRRVRSNTPLQALTLLNEQQFTDCARALAARVIREAPSDDSQRLEHAWLLVLAREPSDDEANTMLAALTDWRHQLQDEELDALAIAGADASDDSASEAAAWTLLARCLLNLDETIVKP